MTQISQQAAKSTHPGKVSSTKPTGPHAETDAKCSKAVEAAQQQKKIAEAALQQLAEEKKQKTIASAKKAAKAKELATKKTQEAEKAKKAAEVDKKKAQELEQKGEKANAQKAKAQWKKAAKAAREKKMKAVKAARIARAKKKKTTKAAENAKKAKAVASQEAVHVTTRKQRGKVPKGHKDITSTGNVYPSECWKRVSRRRIPRGYEVRRKQLWAANKCYTYASLAGSKLLCCAHHYLCILKCGVAGRNMESWLEDLVRLSRRE